MLLGFTPAAALSHQPVMDMAPRWSGGSGGNGGTAPLLSMFVVPAAYLLLRQRRLPQA